MAERSESNRARVVLILALVAAGDAYATSRWLGLSHADRIITGLGFLSGVFGLAALVWRAPRATPTAPWLFHPRDGLDAARGRSRWMVAGASGVVLSSLLPFGAELALAGFVVGLGFALVVLGGIVVSLGYVR